MYFNIVVLCGRLAAPIELRTVAGARRLARLLVTVVSTVPRRRVDVVPVTVWDPSDELLSPAYHPGRQVWVTGSVQRRFCEGLEGRRSRIEVVAHHVEPRRSQP